MDRRYILMALLLFGQQLTAQKHDYVWVFGYDSEVEDTLFGGSFIDFNEDPPNLFSNDLPLDFDITSGSICDSLGNLLFYSNGIQIGNTSGEIVANGNNLNPGVLADEFQDFGYPLDQGLIFIPNPTSSHQFYLVHASRDLFNDQVNSYSKRIYYTLINRTEENLGGVVVSKNQEIIDSELELGKLTACKHGNGRDWWILVRRYSTNEFFTIRLNDRGAHIDNIQSIGDSIPSAGVGQAVFSPDGTKYVRLNMIDFEQGNFLSIYNFDRCSGLLDNPIHINYMDNASAGGVAISPNSRFLYVSSSKYIYQYDLWEDDIESTKDTVAIYDGFQAPFPTLFHHCQLAPNGKIYINTSNGSNILHIIHQPNQKGEACMVEQHGLTLPTYNAFSLPNFPNYRLGPLQGSPCDTLGLTHTASPLSKHTQLLVYPNPSTDFLYLKWKDESTFLKKVFSWRLLDALGREVKRLNFTNNFIAKKVNVADLADGVYFWELRSTNGVIDKGKVVKWNRK